MPTQPEPNDDAYRTLGLKPGVSKAEVKRAYRLLAKAFHPDSAGEVALPRFLAIHEAYDRLTTGRVSSSPKARPAPAAEPWRADPARARQARERARTARGTSARGSSPGAGATGTTGTRGSGRRTTRKATMGSTSYDEARDANDPTWSGASWYGPSSGEYWIVNPREFADPRKHGPEYLSRARRPLPGDAALAGTVVEDPPVATWSSAEPVVGREPRARRQGTSPSATSWSAPAAARAEATADAAATTAANPIRSTSARRIPDPFDMEAAIGAAGRKWIGGAADDPIRRLGMALVAWPPIGLAAAAVIGAATGCASDSAACGGPEPLLPWLAQAVIVGLLLLLPQLTRAFAGGTLAVLLTSVPLTAIVADARGTGNPHAGLALGMLLGAAWLAGVAWSTLRLRRRHSIGAGA